jgi:integrase
MRVRAKLSPELRLAGVPLPDIKDQLGHSDIRTTMKYAHGDLERLRGNLEKLSLRKVEQIRKEAEGGE